MSKQRLYRVTFTNQGQVYEVYARKISHDGLLGFVDDVVRELAALTRLSLEELGSAAAGGGKRLRATSHHFAILVQGTAR